MMNVGGYTFTPVAEIRPDRDPVTGSVLEYDPIASSGCRRHSDGYGPFCRFRLRGLPPRGGVYALTRGGEAFAYFGTTGNLVERFGPRGYGVIYERKCLPGGPRTTCYINARILDCTRAAESVHLWFHEEPREDQRIAIEKELIRRFTPPWNRSGCAPQFGKLLPATGKDEKMALTLKQRSETTNGARVLNYLRRISPRCATNSEIRRSTEVEPHQQVYQITRDLRKRGKIEGTQHGREWHYWVD